MLDPEDLDDRLARAASYRRVNDHDRAIADYDEALRIEPDSADVLHSRGAAYHDKKDYARAIADYTLAIQNEPEWAFPYVSRAIARDCLNETAKAVADLGEAIRLDPGTSLAWSVRGRLRGQVGDYAGAVADLKEAIRLDPDHASFLDELADLRATCPEAKFRDGKEAVALARKAVELSGGKDGWYLDTLAAAHAEAGDFAKAIESETKAVGLFADEPLKARCRSRLELFKQRKPCRDPAPGRSPP